MEVSEGEIIYGADCSEGSIGETAPEQNVMSEKVENLAREIYAEFERMMEKYGNDVVKSLMPLIVNVLESLDLSGIENQEHQVELELVKEDNEQLATQYEREKGLRKSSEQRLIELEYSAEEERSELQSKVQSLESISRMLELKAKTSSDHASRLEDKETEMKKEYAKLHDRYTDLFKSHVDYVEKTKIIFGANQAQACRQSPHEEIKISLGENTDIRSPEELSNLLTLGNFSPDKDLSMSEALNQQSEKSEASQRSDPSDTKVRRPNTLYQECKFTESGEEQEKREDDNPDSLGAGLVVDPAEFASSVGDNIFGMGKEVENIILENIELLATKNALNIVKDDLITRVDQLVSDREILEEKLKTSEVQRTVLKEKIEQIESELKKFKEQGDRTQSDQENGDMTVPMSQRRRFTRVEMARVLMERNQYKEKLMELQEAVRWSETLKATKLTEGFSSSEKPVGLFKFFSNLFNTEKQKAVTSSTGNRESAPRAKASSLHHMKLRDGLSEKKAKQRRDQLKKVKAHVSKDDIGRVQAYGWSLPTASGMGAMTSVPVPVFCRPLDQSDPNPLEKIWCDSGVHSPTKIMNSDVVDRSEMSSLVWICSGIPNRLSQVSVIDANNPAEVLETFDVGTSMILCIQSVPGVRNDDIFSSYQRRKCQCTEQCACIPPKNESGLNEISALAAVSKDEAADTERIEESESPTNPDEPQKMSTELPTMWLGSQNGDLYIHSSRANWSTCIEKVKLSDCVLSIVQHRGRVFCSLANGRVVVFHRSETTKEFDFHNYREILINTTENHSVRCLSIVGNDNIWCGYRNQVSVINAQTFEISGTFSVHPRKESQVRQMVAVGNGVWLTIRLDSTFRLYHAETYQHLQDVDIEPIISRMIGSGKLGFSFVRITCLGSSCDRLWIGTGNGVILSLPLYSNRKPSTVEAEKSSHNSTPSKEEAESPEESPCSIPDLTAYNSKARPGTCTRIDDHSVPYCNINEAQLSFHGHKDSVRFILGVPGIGGMISSTASRDHPEGSTTPPSRCLFVLSGGEGYIDLRIGEGSETCDGISDKSDLSHLIVWEVEI